ncbi:MAG: hypothetical protein V1780_05480 [Chloroflexota bacterium]
MGWLGRGKGANDIIYLAPIRMERERLPEDKVRLLYSDARGNLRSLVMADSVYRRIRGLGKEMARRRQGYAVLGLETAPGRREPYPVPISRDYAWALDSILEHALNHRQTPDILKRYLKEIVGLGEARRQELRKGQPQRVVKSAILDRLAYDLENTAGVTLPLYKAESRFPLVVLERLVPEETALPDTGRLLVLDNDGDLGVISLPLAVIDAAERDLAAWQRGNKAAGCLVYARHSGGLSLAPMKINKLQRHALDVIVQQYQATGHSRQPISASAQAVLVRARAEAATTGRQ